MKKGRKATYPLDRIPIRKHNAAELHRSRPIAHVMLLVMLLILSYESSLFQFITQGAISPSPHSQSWFINPINLTELQTHFGAHCQQLPWNIDAGINGC